MFNLSSDSDSGDETGRINGSKSNEKNSFKDILFNSPALLTGMSHEMRTHMNAIVAFSYIMQSDGCCDSDREEYGEQILKSCEQLMHLFDSFLDSAILDTCKHDSDLRAFEPNTLLSDIISSLRETIEKSEHKDLELISEIQPGDSDIYWIDSNKVSRIILSLFHNSLRTTENGYIKVGYTIKEQNITFFVVDSGNGYFRNKEFFHSNDLNNSLAIFDDTYSAINIALAKKLTNMLGGSIRVECNGLTGTGVYFSIPAKTKQQINPEKKIINTMIAI